MTPFESIVDSMNLSTLSVPSIRITDVIDILLVAMLAYVVIRWVRQTRAWSLFRGLVIIAVVSLLAYKLHFYTITFIIEKTFSVGIIALVVIFQPELRGALEQIGTGGFSGITKIFGVSIGEVKLTAESADEITRACVRMSDSRTGALIVIENAVPTGDFTKSGTNLDCFISEKMLINIFWKNTPLHDGAVVIRNNKIAAAACVLPATEHAIGGELGTRHRAAVGASEVSDAVVIVVSEETGSISVAVGGKLRRNLSMNELREVLVQFTPSPKSTQERKKQGKGNKINDETNRGN
jgi:diadenylate cyclase